MNQKNSNCSFKIYILYMFSYISGQKKNVQYRSIISDIFDGKILSSVQCLTCERVIISKKCLSVVILDTKGKYTIYIVINNAYSSPYAKNL